MQTLGPPCLSIFPKHQMGMLEAPRLSFFGRIRGRALRFLRSSSLRFLIVLGHAGTSNTFVAAGIIQIVFYRTKNESSSDFYRKDCRAIEQSSCNTGLLFSALARKESSPSSSQLRNLMVLLRFPGFRQNLLRLGGKGPACSPKGICV